ncbi:MAG TPA: HEAT repeat domain-containing protein [Pseudomonadota bacterium]|nr:HEAT repeat domain-containing protein [Pseudomonadota bacterium]
MSNPGSTAELLQKLGSSDADVAAEAARGLAARNEASAAPRLLELLRTTDNPRIRNAAALALSDLRQPQAFQVLVDLLRDERTEKNRGTLLYALGTYDCSSILPLLVDLVIAGNFEVSLQALSLIQGIEIELDDRQWAACTARLRAALSSASEERRLLIGELLALFEDGDTMDTPT